MTRASLIEKLKQLTGNSHVNISSHIKIAIKDHVLSVHLDYPFENMQDDKSAFEGWIIPIKALIPSIEQVDLLWNPHVFKGKKQHYNRFLYRVIMFSRMYKWFIVSSPNLIDELDKFKIEIAQDLIINYPTTEKKPTTSKNKKEDIIESLYVNEYSHLLLQQTGVEYINQQLPVGVFKGEKGRDTRFFTGQKSAIDLWGVDKKREALYIFELKYDNNGVGILSELFFYLCVMAEVFLYEKGNINYPDNAKGLTHRGLDKLYGKKFKQIKGYFLTDNLHPLIDNPKVIALFNDGLKNLGNIVVSSLIYKCDIKLSWK